MKAAAEATSVAVSASKNSTKVKSKTDVDSDNDNETSIGGVTVNIDVNNRGVENNSSVSCDQCEEGDNGIPEEKVLLCHEGNEIMVDESAVPAHLAHGDTLGPCPDESLGEIPTGEETTLDTSEE